MKKIGVKKSKYEEMNSIADINFRYSVSDNLLEELSSISSNLHYLPFKFSLTGSSLFDNYDEDKITNLLEDMTPQNSIILLSS